MPRENIKMQQVIVYKNARFIDDFKRHQHFV